MLNESYIRAALADKERERNHMMNVRRLHTSSPDVFRRRPRFAMRFRLPRLAWRRPAAPNANNGRGALEPLRRV